MGSAVHTCMLEMKGASTLPKGPSKAQVVDFCSGASTVEADKGAAGQSQSPLAACYLASEKVRGGVISCAWSHRS